MDDARWLPHRYDESADGFRFIRLERSAHRAATFITDDHIEASGRYEFISRHKIEQAQLIGEEAHFVFHSAYCCSTMVARAFDIEGASMGLKEPQVLNDLVGWKRRGAPKAELRNTLGTSMRLLARPFATGEAVIIKPSNIANSLAASMLEVRPNARALFLHAPIDSYLQSIAKKGLWGRRWVREVLLGTIEDGYLVGGFEDENLLGLTDLQVAAIGWLSQHALFSELQSRFGTDRIKTLDSATWLANQATSMRALINHFKLEISDSAFEAVISGPAFTTHSKSSSQSFDARSRAKEQENMARIHGEEIGMVVEWTKAVAQSQGIELTLPAPLVR